MGNRAVITTEDKDLGVYLHWNGGRDSVEAFLFYCKLKEYRCPENDCYGWARLCQVIGNFFGGEYSVGIDRYTRLDTDNGDNGVYIIKNWEIIGKEFEPLEDRDEARFREMVETINASQLVNEQFDDKTLKEKLDEYLKSTITVKQIKAIHAIIKELGIELPEYHSLLKILYKAPTCKDLSQEQASNFIEYLNKLRG